MPRRAATAGYLATAGSGKTNFSRSDKGEPARGVRGLVERNAMRHYLALLAVLDTAAVSDAGRTAARLDRYSHAHRSLPRAVARIRPHRVCGLRPASLPSSALESTA